MRFTYFFNILFLYIDLIENCRYNYIRQNRRGDILQYIVFKWWFDEE